MNMQEAAINTVKITFTPIQNIKGKVENKQIMQHTSSIAQGIVSAK